jgi:hypothetical protein
MGNFPPFAESQKNSSDRAGNALKMPIGSWFEFDEPDESPALLCKGRICHRGEEHELVNAIG